MPQIIGVSRVLAVVFLVVLAGCSDPKPAAKPAEPAKAALEAEPAEKAEKKEKRERPEGEQGAKPKKLELGACAAAVHVGKRMNIVSDVAGTDPLRKITLAGGGQAAADTAASGSTTITVYARAESDKTKKVVDLAKARHRAPAQTQAIKLGGVSAAYTQLAGQSKMDAVTIACDDKVVEISTTYADAASGWRKGFSWLVSSLTVGETRVGEGCPRKGERGCAAPHLAVCEGGKWTCAAPKKDDGKAPAKP